MGMFDNVICEYPIDAPGGMNWQTHDTPSQFCDSYKIDADGHLWREDYDIEDRSDPNAEGIMALAGCMTPVNKRWVRVESFRGEIRFYGTANYETWWEYSALFDAGKLLNIRRLSPADTEHTDE